MTDEHSYMKMVPVIQLSLAQKHTANWLRTALKDDILINQGKGKVKMIYIVPLL